MTLDEDIKALEDQLRVLREHRNALAQEELRRQVGDELLLFLSQHPKDMARIRIFESTDEFEEWNDQGETVEQCPQFFIGNLRLSGTTIHMSGYILQLDTYEGKNGEGDMYHSFLSIQVTNVMYNNTQLDKNKRYILLGEDNDYSWDPAVPLENCDNEWEQFLKEISKPDFLYD